MVEKIKDDHFPDDLLSTMAVELPRMVDIHTSIVATREDDNDLDRMRALIAAQSVMMERLVRALRARRAQVDRMIEGLEVRVERRPH